MGKMALKLDWVGVLGAAFALSACGGPGQPDESATRTLPALEQAAACETCEPDGSGGSSGPISPHIEFFEGNDLLQDSLGKVYLPPHGEFRSYDLTAAGTNIGIPNDEARSMALRKIPVGTRIVLCDCPHPEWWITGSCTKADKVTYTVQFSEIVGMGIGSFETNSSSSNLISSYVQQPFRNERSLDGKVSVIQIFAPGVSQDVFNSVGCDF